MRFDSYDYVIVGSGSAGGFLVLRLSEDPSVKVLLLEAGPTDAHWTTHIPAAARYTYSGGSRNWCFETEPEPHMDNRRLFQPRGKTLGGSSSLNGMVFVRGHAQDYDRWAEEGATGWSYRDVLPYFKKLERYKSGANEYRGAEGPIAVHRLVDNHPIEDAFLEAGVQAGHRRSHDYNGADQEGVTAFDVNIDGAYRSATARECIAPARRRPNVTVLTDAHAMRVMLEKGKAVGVEYRHAGQVKQVHADCEVILSAGAFGSPQLLMLSGIGPDDELKAHAIKVLHNLPGVGCNLQDHLEVHIKHRCAEGLSKNGMLRQYRVILAGLEWFLFKTGPAATTHSRVGAFFKGDGSVKHPNIQYHFWPYYLEGWSPPPDKDGYCFDVGPVRSQSRGWVKLRSADPFAAPRIQLNGLSKERDLIEFRRAIRMARDIAAQPAFDFCRGPEVVPGPDVASDTQMDAYVRAYANSAYHPCGTCKMGIDEMSVVDPQTRVHGIEGLRVIDASIMPSIPSGNINAPSMMIGEKAADLILGRPETV